MFNKCSDCKAKVYSPKARETGQCYDCLTGNSEGDTITWNDRLDSACKDYEDSIIYCDNLPL